MFAQDPAFSNKALFQQQDTVLKYVNMLMTAIQEESRKGPINLVDYFNWVTSDGKLPSIASYHFAMPDTNSSWRTRIQRSIRLCRE